MLGDDDRDPELAADGRRRDPVGQSGVGVDDVRPPLADEARHERSERDEVVLDERGRVAGAGPPDDGQAGHRDARRPAVGGTANSASGVATRS